jgi:hypothetical protein
MNALTLLAVAGLAVAAAPADAPAPTLRPNAAGCADAIRQVRESNGLPALDKQVAHPGEGLFIAAVDKRIDDCRVLVMARDKRDIRPEPAPADGRAGLIPAR